LRLYGPQERVFLALVCKEPFALNVPPAPYLSRKDRSGACQLANVILMVARELCATPRRDIILSVEGDKRLRIRFPVHYRRRSRLVLVALCLVPAKRFHEAKPQTADALGVYLPAACELTDVILRITA